jgi:mannose-6-phosphate isomerase-like protein (cupin superfamily)
MRSLSGLKLTVVSSVGIAASIWLLSGTAFPADTLNSWTGPLPTANFDHAPKQAFDRSDYFFKFDQLEHYYRVPGEFGHRMWGEKYGFEALSLIITETHPGGGPRLHTHNVEEAHVLLKGSAKYLIGDRAFTVEAPYVAKVPAGTPHTFINTGSAPMNIIAIFPSKSPDVKIVGPNPLIRLQEPNKQ